MPESLSSPLEVLWASQWNTEDGRCPLEDIPYSAQSIRLSCWSTGKTTL